MDVARGGLGELKLVDLAETAVKESVSRIQAAPRNSGYEQGLCELRRLSEQREKGRCEQ